jgi:hypothetical protein
MASARHTARLIGLALGLSFVLPRVAPRPGLAEAACTENNFDPSALRGDAAEGGWLVYRNAGNGLSFRYPSSMQVKEQDPATFGYDKPFVPDVIVDLRAHGDVVMRFICGGREQTPQMAAAMLQRQREQAAREHHEAYLRSMQIDGHEAILASVRGGGACSYLWRVAILQPRGCDIFPLGSSDDSSPPLHDGHFPLLSIIETVHFDPVPNKR